MLKEHRREKLSRRRNSADSSKCRSIVRIDRLHQSSSRLSFSFFRLFPTYFLHRVLFYFTTMDCCGLCADEDREVWLADQISPKIGLSGMMIRLFAKHFAEPCSPRRRTGWVFLLLHHLLFSVILMWGWSPLWRPMRCTLISAVPFSCRNGCSSSRVYGIEFVSWIVSFLRAVVQWRSFKQDEMASKMSEQGSFERLVRVTGCLLIQIPSCSGVVGGSIRIYRGRTEEGRDMSWIEKRAIQEKVKAKNVFVRLSPFTSLR